ncbi:MAG: spore protease YyaC [Thermovenabulum sp.]|uniref:spore protease YyaC n=1 Tax=Thermovenabulum sp. TaxID=3100335 RepID=UPI003C7BE290
MIIPQLLKTNEIRVHIDNPFASDILGKGIFKILEECYEQKGEIIFLCIGTDRSTGDSLGPIVGNILMENPYIQGLSNIHIYGCLKEPVHAGNIEKVIEQLNNLRNKPFIIAIDASLGRIENIGTIKLGKGPLKPGAGVKKELPPVGSYHITGTVNFGGIMEYLILQNTRLYIVMQMSKIIADAIFKGLKLYFTL